MKIEMTPAYISYHFEEESFYELGYTVLMKEKNPSIMKGYRIFINASSKVLYPGNGRVSLPSVNRGMGAETVQDVIHSIFFVIREMKERGFLAETSIDIDYERMFFDEQEKSVNLIVLPVQEGFDLHDALTWNQRLCSTLCRILENSLNGEANSVKILCKSLKNRDYTTEELEKMVDSFFQSHAQDLRKQDDYGQNRGNLTLSYRGIMGNFTMYVRKEVFVIGKNQEAVDGYIPISQAVSRCHCQLEKREGSYYIRDLGSVNHTYVNDEIVIEDELRLIQAGDRIRLADIVLEVDYES